MRTVNLRLSGTLLMALMVLSLAGCSRVKDDWKAAQTTDTAAAYQQFIRDHADSEYSSQAEARIQQLLEDADWKAAAALDTRDAYEQFLAQHADGKWAQEARVRIENFKLAVAGGNAAPGAAPAPAPSPGAPAAPTAPPAPKPATPPLAKPAPAAPKPAPAPAAKPASKAVAAGKAVRVQLGAFASTTSAKEAWAKVKAQWPKQTAGLVPHYESVQSGGKTLVRLRVALPGRSQAEQFCAALKKQKHDCMIAG
jgi:cell division septation protein DedD